LVWLSSAVHFGFYILAVNVTEALFAMFTPISQIVFTRVLGSAAAHAMMRIMTRVTAAMGKPTLATIALGTEIAEVAACSCLWARASAPPARCETFQVCRMMRLSPVKLFVPKVSDVRFAVGRVQAVLGRRGKQSS
jgi:hypothetical protein